MSNFGCDQKDWLENDDVDRLMREGDLFDQFQNLSWNQIRYWVTACIRLHLPSIAGQLDACKTETFDCRAELEKLLSVSDDASCAAAQKAMVDASKKLLPRLPMPAAYDCSSREEYLNVISSAYSHILALCSLFGNAGVVIEILGEFLRDYSDEETAKQAMPYLHDVVGDPFQPVHFKPEWRTPAAIGVAQTCWDTRDFTDMPVLGDALEDVGCNELILEHCRSERKHVRGCWVVRKVLGY